MRQVFWILLILFLLAQHSGRSLETAGGTMGYRFPDSSRLDFRHTLHAPAGKRGFVTVGKDGKFRFGDGSRARFWGINVSSTRLNIPPEQIEEVCDVFARAGLNLVRLEAIDNRNCILGSVDAPGSRQLDPLYLDRIDRWIHALRRRGIYYYLDLLDFRTFKEGDGVLNADKLDRAARPYAVFDRYLIDLQKEYATQLLTHKNPYTGLRPIDDPALAMIEICNEHGFFLYPEKLETLVEPYRADLRNRWNQWLLHRYGTREKLAKAWGKIQDVSVLRDSEDPSEKSVDLPLLIYTYGKVDRNVVDTRRGPGRLRDGVHFLAELQRAYFREIRTHVRQLGLRVPVTAVVSNDVIPDVASVAEECDFTSENWYGDGPGGDPRYPDLKFYSNRNPLRDASAGGYAPFTAALRWNNKPVVIREWATPWPNRYRAASIPEALAYSALQDYDAVLLFGYQTNTALNGTEPDVLNDFAAQSDPTVWGLAALAGQAFLRGDIRPARQTVTLHHPPSTRYRWPHRIDSRHTIAYTSRLNSSTQAGKREEGRGKRTPKTQKPKPKTGILRSDTGEIVRYTKEGRLEVTTPRLRMLAGELTPGKTYTLGGLKISTSTRIAGLLAIAMDGKSLEHSGHIVIKMVSRAENTAEKLERASPGSVKAWKLTHPGRAPVVTRGKKATKPTRVWLDAPGKKSASPLLTLYLEDGTWELERKAGRLTLHCDTEGIRGFAQGKSFTTMETVVEIPPAQKTARAENSP